MFDVISMVSDPFLVRRHEHLPGRLFFCCFSLKAFPKSTTLSEGIIPNHCGQWQGMAARESNGLVVVEITHGAINERYRAFFAWGKEYQSGFPPDAMRLTFLAAGQQRFFL